MSRGRRPAGTVYLVGAGPGDPGLITSRGRDLLSRADVVIRDALASRDLLDLAPPPAEIILAGKRGGRAGADQGAVNRLMIDRARRGLTVVRLKGGDPTLFGRVGEEASALRRARIPFEIVPGVTAALGAAAFTGIPLTDRRHASTVTFATGHLDPGKEDGGTDWEALARSGTLVLYMGVRRLAGIVGRLRNAGMAGTTPVALVRWATLPEQRVLVGTLQDIAGRARAARIDPPALLIAGNVVRLRRVLDWQARLPLRGRTIVITRPRHQAAPFADALRAQGARVLLAPVIDLLPPRSYAPLDRAIARLGAYDALIFTSANGVARFFSRLDARGADVRDLKGVEIIAIGPATAAAVEAHGLRVGMVPDEFRAEGILEALSRRDLRGARVLIPRATVARDVLIRALRGRGADVEVVPVYRTVPSREGAAQVREALRSGRLDLVAFTSSSTVTSFAALFRGRRDARLLRRVAVAAIGPITAATARRVGFRVVVVPRAYTVDGLAEAIVRRFRSSPSGTPRGT
ncbi:MAG TPA: uroporphyrinogen-III C-methyltransferase [Candidatus Polarisedimenticolia bacterium]|nr:uroporphyrinogen-III C-methyltransferase [Candidatus Polarisedimenticolia bacterium]